MEQEIETYVKDLCREHLEGEDYEVIFNNKHSNKLGRCRNVRRNAFTVAHKLYFNVPYLTYCYENNDLDSIRDVTLHEIAHAKAGLGHGHDDYWKKIMESIGGNPSRLRKTDYHPYKHIYECPRCHRQIKRMRKIREGLACGKCCKEYNNGKYSKEYAFVLVSSKERNTL